MTRGPQKQFDTEVALTKAMEVFWAHGYEATSISELMKNMRIGKKSLYDTFGNKKSLFIKALEHYSQTTVSQMRDRLFSEGSAWENLKQLILEWQEMHSQPGSCGCMFGTNIADFTTENEEIAKLLRSYLQKVEDLFCTALTQAKESGEIGSSVEPRDLARFLVCTTQGVALVGRVMKDELTLKGAISTVLKLLDNS